MPTEDKLKLLLTRARQTVERNKQQELKLRLRRKFAQRARSAEAISEDYAKRLQDRARFRALLSDDRLDGERFRWYCQHFTDGDLNSMRVWIDERMFSSRNKEVS